MHNVSYNCEIEHFVIIKYWSEKRTFGHRARQTPQCTYIYHAMCLAQSISQNASHPIQLTYYTAFHILISRFLCPTLYLTTISTGYIYVVCILNFRTTKNGESFFNIFFLGFLILKSTRKYRHTSCTAHITAERWWRSLSWRWFSPPPPHMVWKVS